MSLTVMRPRRKPSSSTTGSFSMRFFQRMSLASSSVVPTEAVTSGGCRMTLAMGWSTTSTNRRSRLVRMPTRRPSGSVIGTPEMWYFAMIARADSTGASGGSVTGSTIMPDCERLTLSTSATWSATDRLRCTMPMPPARAMAMARGASVTVSIAAETMGSASSMCGVRRVLVSTAAGTTPDSAGSRSTSSKVRPSLANFAGYGPDASASSGNGFRGRSMRKSLAHRSVVVRCSLVPPGPRGTGAWHPTAAPLTASGRGAPSAWVVRPSKFKVDVRRADGPTRESPVEWRT